MVFLGMVCPQGPGLWLHGVKRGTEKGDESEQNCGQVPPSEQWRVLAPHWPELSHVATPTCLAW